jgi:hypothetical protein
MDDPLALSPLSTPQRESNLLPIIIGLCAVAIVAAVGLWMVRPSHKAPTGPPPYASSLKISDLRMSAAQNFAGTTITYIDGNITNTGDKLLTRAVMHVVFSDSMAQIAQADDVPIRVLQTTGPYPDAVDLSVAPLAPGQTSQFRLTFEHVSNEWNQAYPELQIAVATVK